MKNKTKKRINYYNIILYSDIEVFIMKEFIRTSLDLRNKYNEISKLCRETKNL